MTASATVSFAASTTFSLSLTASSALSIFPAVSRYARSVTGLFASEKKQRKEVENENVKKALAAALALTLDFSGGVLVDSVNGRTGGVLRLLHVGFHLLRVFHDLIVGIAKGGLRRVLRALTTANEAYDAAEQAVADAQKALEEITKAHNAAVGEAREILDVSKFSSSFCALSLASLASSALFLASSSVPRLSSASFLSWTSWVCTARSFCAASLSRTPSTFRPSAASFAASSRPWASVWAFSAASKRTIQRSPNCNQPFTIGKTPV